LKKYKIRKKKNLISPYYIFFAFTLLSLVLSTGYAFLSDNLNISGYATFSTSTNVQPGISTYSYSLLNTWANASGGMTYQIEIIFNNLDGDIDPWQISFDVPDGFLVTSNIWQASSVTLSGNTVTIKAKDWNSYIANNSSYTFNFILDFDREVDFSISNISVNGFLAQCIDSE